MKHRITIEQINNYAMLFMLAVVLSSCASLQDAGVAQYSIKPFQDAAGVTRCCDVQIKNGKEIGSLKASITNTDGNFSVQLEEAGITAFQGQAIAAHVTQTALDAAAKAAVASALAPMLPMLIPAAGAALTTPGIGAAAVGAGAAIGAEKLLANPSDTSAK